MNNNGDPIDIEIMFQTLRFAARQIVSELDPELLASHALDMVADFSGSNCLSLLLINEANNSVKISANLRDGHFSTPNEIITLTPTLKQVLETKKSFATDITDAEYCIFHDSKAPAENGLIHCLPLIGTKNKVDGFIVLLIDRDSPLTKIQEEILGVLNTMIATTIENANLFKLATIDGLTGLYVRRYFDIRLQEEITRLGRMESNLALVMTDIDHFKNVNDTYGHQQGDVILRDLAQIFRNAIRKDLDIPCRFGGEEFVVILPGTNLEGAIVFAERLRRKCEAYPYPYGNEFLHVTISGGVIAIDSKHILTKDDLVKAVDEKLYEAKESGRNRVKF